MTELKHYQAHKKVHARPMDLGEYNRYRGWNLPQGERPDSPGYLVVYSAGTNDHYESWSPKHVFDAGYSEIS